MSSHVSEEPRMRSVEFPTAALAEIQRAAERYGLTPAAYLLMLHAVRSGDVDPSILESVREVFTRDRAILEELAK